PRTASSRPARPQTQPPALPTTGGTVALTKIEFTAVDGKGGPVELPARFTEYLACGDGIDLAVRGRSLLLMKEKGRFKRIYHREDRRFNFTGVCFDGRYVWAPAAMGDEPMVVVLDPVSERTWTITAADGLPPMSRGAKAAPLEPGRVCLAGSLGRGWIADVRFDEATGQKSVDVFFEAREQNEDHDHQAWRNLHQQFTPTWAVALHGRDEGGKQARRVLVGRTYHPLLVDPDARRVEVVHDTVSGAYSGDDLAARDGALYWAMPAIGRDGDHKLWRFGFPELRRVAVNDNLPMRDGYVAFEGERVHVVEQLTWYAAPRLGQPFVQLAGRVPGVGHYRAFAHSSHYGLVMLSQTDREPGVFSVKAEFAPRRAGAGPADAPSARPTTKGG
ncbi:MAG: hypothetical protein M3478_12090, partial [Planctomycetota bacterium]|nr:hypothetical protein [Planctomycetota bacterium]